MSSVLLSARTGALPSSKSETPYCRHITIQLYCEASFKYKRHEFTSACLAIMLPTEQCKTRSNCESDTTLKFLCGIIAKNEKSHPPWEGKLLQAVPRDSVLGVETPNSPENFSAVSVEHAVDGRVVQLKVLGTRNLELQMNIALLVRSLETM